MSERLAEKIKQEAKKPFKICYKCYQDLEEGKTDGVPDCCNDCELFERWIPEKDVLKILEDEEKKNLWIFDNTCKLLDSKTKQIEETKQKLRELADAIKNRPSWEWMKDNLDKLEDIESAFRKVEKKFAELGVKNAKEK